MNSRIGKPVFWLLFGFALLAASLPTPADDYQVEVRRAVNEGRIRPLADILAAVEARYPQSKVVDVEIEHDHIRNLIYEIKLLDANGRKFKIEVDAASGREFNADLSATEVTKVIPMRELLTKVLTENPGWIIEIELIYTQWETPYYEVTVQTLDGKNKELKFDAQTGESLTDNKNTGWNISGLKSLPEILQFVESKYAGMIVEAELEHTRDGRLYYEIELKQQNGRIMELHIDAKTMEIISNKDQP